MKPPTLRGMSYRLVPARGQVVTTPAFLLFACVVSHGCGSGEHKSTDEASTSPPIPVARGDGRTQSDAHGETPTASVDFSTLLPLAPPLSHQQLLNLIPKLRLPVPLISDKQCGPSDASFLVDARLHSNTHLAHGPSDTLPEKVVVLRTGACNQPVWKVESRISVWSGDRVISMIDNACGAETMLLPDERMAGGQVVLGLCSGAGQGYIEKTAKIYGIERGVLAVLRDLGSVYWENCGATDQGKVVYSILDVGANGRIEGNTLEKSCDGGAAVVQTILHSGFVHEDDKFQ